MNIRPLNDNTKVLVPTLQVKKVKTRVIADPTGVLPNTIYKIVRWEKIRQFAILGLAVAVILTCVILILLYALILPSIWATFLVPSLILLMAIWKLANTVIEISAFKKSVARYREDLKIGLASTPPFISKLYVALFRKQVGHNWFTFFVIFYGGIITLLLWLLKDVSWWIFEFQKWINALFSDPELMAWLFTGFLIFIIVVHIFMAVQRRKRMLDIDAYFGVQIIPHGEVETIKQSLNKFYRRIFIFSVLIILVIPILVWIVLRVMRLRK